MQLHLDVETMAQILGLDFDGTRPFRLGSECFLPDTGRHLSDAEAARFLCEGTIQVLVHHHGVPLWLSNETRVFTRPQRRAMRFRSGGRGGCEFPGCTHDRYLDGHHVRFHAGRAPHVVGQRGVPLRVSPPHSSTNRNGGSSSTATRPTRSGTAPDVWARPLRRDPARRTGPRPHGPPRTPTDPDLPEHGIDTDTPKSGTRGERITPYALDVYLEALLTA